MSRCFIIFIASASCPLEHHHVGRLSDDLERDRRFVVGVENPDNIVQRPVEETEASRLTVARPGLELLEGVPVDVVAVEVALNLCAREPLQGGIKVDPVREAVEVGLDLRLEAGLSGDYEADVGLIEYTPENLHLLLCILAYELVGLVDDNEITLVDVAKLPDAVDPLPDCAVGGGDSERPLNRLHKVAAAHGVVTFHIGDPGHLCVILEGVGLAESALRDHDAEADVLLCCAAYADDLLHVPALEDVRPLL